MSLNEPSSASVAIEPAMLTIPEFARFCGISVPLFHQLQREGTGPRTTLIGRRRLISRTAALQWLQEREAETSPQQ